MLSVQRYKTPKTLADTQTNEHTQSHRDDPALRSSRLSLSISDQEGLDYLLEHIWSEWYLHGGGLKSSEIAVEVFREIQRPFLEQLHEEGTIQTSKEYKDAFQEAYKKNSQDLFAQMDHLQQGQKNNLQYLQRVPGASRKDDKPYQTFLREGNNSSQKEECIVRGNAS
ncbi:hypothetical protein BCON_0405g00040 [Botryotinia convoluta]|uniref:Uncharacterized protein n=1 Tax=Botryotinia convoluta TaxID=54673 RepID=A0A4Z1H8V8_9HELO|nr:hypothetical protein BCON_0405g00040 [Botryotinia convoluta]